MTVPNLTPARRRRLYELAIAACSVAVVYGLTTGDKAQAWLLLVGAVLGVARKNVPSDPTL
jgi:hypothetical protein